MDQISIVGGSGFIGSELIGMLKGGNFSIFNIDKKNAQNDRPETIICDITDKDSLVSAIPENSDWIILLAAEHKDDISRSLYYDVNVEGTKNVLQVMRKKGINKLIFTSSVAVYGLNKPDPDESFETDPFNDYGKSKFIAEEELRNWYLENPEERSLVIIRPTVVFGPGNRGNVYNLLKQISSGKFLMIGSGENKKSMAYVENIAGFIRFILEKKITGYHLFNYSDKPDLSTKELVRIAEKTLNKKLPSIRIPYFVGYMIGLSFDVISKISGKKFPISSVRIKKFCATTQFNSDKVKNMGYLPPYSLENGLAKTLENEFSKSNTQ